MAAERADSQSGAMPQHDVIIIGAGVCGIYQLYRLLELDLDVTVVEAGDGPGGTRHMVQEVKRRTGRVTWVDTRTL